MARQIEASRAKPPLIKRAAATVILVAIAALVVHFAIGLIMAVFWIVVAIAAVLAAVWAVKTVF